VKGPLAIAPMFLEKPLRIAGMMYILLWFANLGNRFNFDLQDALANTTDLATCQSLLQSARTAQERLAATDPGNAGWQRDIWVSCWRLATMPEQQPGRNAHPWWQKAYDVLTGTQRRRMFLSLQDEQCLNHMRNKLGQ